ncbi:MAG: DUF5615 family PIN-like protein [Bacteroidota bacterium]
MKLFVDENIPSITVDVLRSLKHEVKDIRGTGIEGASDEIIWKICQNEKRLIITTDKGFVQYRNEFHSGIIIVTLRKPNEQKIHQRIITALRNYPENEWNNLLVIMKDVVQSVWKH